MAAFYVDPLFVMEAKHPHAFRVGERHGHQWCHLWTDGTEEELIDFAAKIGMKPQWIQRKRGFVHFDLVPPRRAAALALGAKEVNLREWLEQTRFDQTVKAIPEAEGSQISEGEADA